MKENEISVSGKSLHQIIDELRAEMTTNEKQTLVAVSQKIARGAEDPPCNQPLPQDHNVLVPDGLLHRIRLMLHKWSQRYADAPHARHSVKDTRLLIQEIDALRGTPKIDCSPQRVNLRVKGEL